MNNDINTMYSEWKRKPNSKTLTPLIQRLDPIIDKAVNAYGYSGDINIKNTARNLAIKSLDKYDPNKAGLETFVFGELRRLQRIGPKQEFALAMPERVLFERKSLNNAIETLSNELGREPTFEEVKDRTGLSTKRLNTLYRLPTQTQGTKTDTEGQVIADGVDEYDPSRLWQESVVLSFDPIDRKIYELVSSNKGLSKVQIAKKLGISPAAVTQRTARMSEKLSEGVVL